MKDLKHKDAPLPKYRAKAVILLTAVAVFSILAGLKSTFAWLTDEEKPLQAVFKPVQVACAIEEQFENNEKQAVKVKNTGETAAYIRLAAIGNYTDERGAVTAPADLQLNLSDTWFQGADGFYYYQNAVMPDELTEMLFKGSIQNSDGLQVDILAEALQAQGEEGKIPAVQQAWSAVTTDANGRLIAVQGEGA